MKHEEKNRWMFMEVDVHVHGRILIAQKLMPKKGRESMLDVGRRILSDRI